MKKIKPFIQEIIPDIISLRRRIHAEPERGYDEVETSRKVIEMIETIPGMDIKKNIAKTGIAATLGKEKQGPCVALRADMDALPLQEENDKPYASKIPGCMHACGHDGHTACLVGAAMVLGKIQDELNGPVKFIFQPAEEGGSGGLRMCEEGVLEEPTVDAIYGLHCNPSDDLQLGDVALCNGPVMAACAVFNITIHGKGGHTAFPQECIDPVFVGVQVYHAIQSIIPRISNPLESAVVMVSNFHAGGAVNVVPETANLKGTIRSLSQDLLKDTCETIKKQAHGIADAYGAEIDVSIMEGYPTVVNHLKSTRIFEQIASEVLPAEVFKRNYRPMLGGEDFTYFTQHVPGTFWFLGTRPVGAMDYPFNHHPKFDFNDDALAIGIEMHCETARRFPSLWAEYEQNSDSSFAR